MKAFLNWIIVYTLTLTAFYQAVRFFLFKLKFSVASLIIFLILNSVLSYWVLKKIDQRAHKDKRNKWKIAALFLILTIELVGFALVHILVMASTLSIYFK